MCIPNLSSELYLSFASPDAYLRLLFTFRNAVRRSVLCNLTGKPGKFQGNDWVVELNNLYTKVRVSICFHLPTDANVTQKNCNRLSTAVKAQTEQSIGSFRSHH